MSDKVKHWRWLAEHCLLTNGRLEPSGDLILHRLLRAAKAMDVPGISALTLTQIAENYGGTKQATAKGVVNFQSKLLKIKAKKMPGCPSSFIQVPGAEFTQQ